MVSNNYTLNANLAFSVFIFFVSSASAGESSSDEEQQQIKSELAELEQKIVQIEAASEASTGATFGNELLRQGVALIGIAGTAGFTAFFAWRHEKRIPPTVEQEKILNEIVTEWYSRSHLKVYAEFWEKIEKAEAKHQEKEVENAWERLCVKEFPKDLFNSREIERDIKEYIKKRLHIDVGIVDRLKEYIKKRLHIDNNAGAEGNHNELDKRIKVIINASSANYYHRVREILPSVAEIAVLATIGEKAVVDKGYEDIVEESLRKLKRLMVFYRLREDKKVVEIVVRSVVSTKMPARII